MRACRTEVVTIKEQTKGLGCMWCAGLVSVYDNQKFTDKLQAQLPYRPHIRPLYAPMKQATATPRGSLSSYPVCECWH